jgi:hypothetical protein
LALNPPIAKNSSKQVVFNAIRDCSDAKMNKIDDNMFQYTSEQLPLHLQKGPKWTMLLGEEIQMPDGFGGIAGWRKDFLDRRTKKMQKDSQSGHIYATTLYLAHSLRLK